MLSGTACLFTASPNGYVLKSTYRRKQCQLLRVRTRLPASMADKVKNWMLLKSSKKLLPTERWESRCLCRKSGSLSAGDLQRLRLLIILVPEENVKNEWVFEQQMPYTDLAKSASRTVACCSRMGCRGKGHFPNGIRNNLGPLIVVETVTECSLRGP